MAVQRIDKLTSGKLEPEWKQQIHVITGVTASGEIKFTSIDRSLPMVESLIKAIEMCELTWKELASLIHWLQNHGVSLD